MRIVYRMYKPEQRRLDHRCYRSPRRYRKQQLHVLRQRHHPLPHRQHWWGRERRGTSCYHRHRDRYRSAINGADPSSHHHDPLPRPGLFTALAPFCQRLEFARPFCSRPECCECQQCGRIRSRRDSAHFQPPPISCSYSGPYTFNSDP